MSEFRKSLIDFSSWAQTALEQMANAKIRTALKFTSIRLLKRPGRKSDLAFLSKTSLFGTTWTKGLLRVSVSGTRGCGGSRFFVLSARSQAESARYNGHDHDRFDEFQCSLASFRLCCFGSSRRGTPSKQRFFGCFAATSYSRMITCVVSSTSVNNSITSAFRIRMQP